MARTDTLPHFLTDVADAIRTKGGTSETIQASTFDTAITNLPSGGNISDYFATTGALGSTSSGIVRIIKKIPSITLTGNNASYMFANCSNLIEIEDITLTGTVNNFEHAFDGCSSLINAPNLDMSNATTCMDMFKNCSSLVSVDFSNTEGTKLGTTTRMFSGCSKLNFIDFRTIDLTTIVNKTNMFQSVPTSCEIIVADQTQKTWMNTNFSSYTNVKTIEEYENE